MLVLKFIQVFKGPVAVWAKQLQLDGIARRVIVMQCISPTTFILNQNFFLYKFVFCCEE